MNGGVAADPRHGGGRRRDRAGVGRRSVTATHHHAEWCGYYGRSGRTRRHHPDRQRPPALVAVRHRPGHSGCPPRHREHSADTDGAEFTELTFPTLPDGTDGVPPCAWSATLSGFYVINERPHDGRCVVEVRVPVGGRCCVDCPGDDGVRRPRRAAERHPGRTDLARDQRKWLCPLVRRGDMAGLRLRGSRRRRMVRWCR